MNNNNSKNNRNFIGLFQRLEALYKKKSLHSIGAATSTDSTVLTQVCGPSKTGCLETVFQVWWNIEDRQFRTCLSGLVKHQRPVLQVWWNIEDRQLRTCLSRFGGTSKTCLSGLVEIQRPPDWNLFFRFGGTLKTGRLEPVVQVRWNHEDRQLRTCLSGLVEHRRPAA